MSWPTPINLNPNKKSNDLEISSKAFAEGLVSHCYAYLQEKRLFIFFNPLTQQQENKIKLVLGGLFKEKKCDPSLDDQSEKLSNNNNKM